MQTVVITGSSRGFGFALAKKFRELGWNVVLSASHEEPLKEAARKLSLIFSDPARVLWTVCDVRKKEDLQNLWDFAARNFGSVDIWINNAGVNCPGVPVCVMNEEEISYVLDIDLKGMILGSQVSFKEMMKQEFGQIYNIEGYGSDDAMMTGLTLYGTSKRALTYFTRSLAKESHELTKDGIQVCRLTPGIMITDFLTSANGGRTKISLSEQTRKVYNILGDEPQTIADWCVPKMIANQKNDAKIVWLTRRKAFWRFLTAGFKKRDFFDHS